MTLLAGLFGKKKILKGDEIKKLLDTNAALREPCILLRENGFKFVSDIIGFDGTAFHLKNTLTRDEVLYEVKGKELRAQFPYELTMYSGDTRLMGLGMMQGVHTLKLGIPLELEQAESRGAYRISRFPDQPTVTFTTDNFDIIKARLADLSMTGAGLRLDPRYASGHEKLSQKLSIIIDIRLNEAIRISTTAIVRYVRGPKMGVEFDTLNKAVKDKLFKYIVEQRREESRAMAALRSRVWDSGEATQEKVEAVTAPTSGKPTVLIAGADQEISDTLTGALTRKFDLLYGEPSISDIRNQVALKPNLCLIELQPDNQEQVRTMRKAATLLPPGCVLMFYGKNFDESFMQRWETLDYPDNILVDATSKPKLMLFKQIQGYYEQRAPK